MIGERASSGPSGDHLAGYPDALHSGGSFFLLGLEEQRHQVQPAVHHAAEDTDDDQKPYELGMWRTCSLPAMFKAKGDAIMTRPARIGKA